MSKISTRLKLHYLPMIAISALAAGIMYLAWKVSDIGKFVADATGYISIFFLLLSLVLGTINLLLKRRNPVSTYIRRDTGIFGGLLALLHSITGLFVHLKGKMWLYFVIEAGQGYSAGFDTFRMANYTGALASLIIFVLILISNNYSLRVLKAGRWKNLQRLAYVMFLLVIVHAILYSIVSAHIFLVFCLYIPVMLAVLVFQIIGIRLKLRTGRTAKMNRPEI